MERAGVRGLGETEGSMLCERECRIGFFFGRSAVDLERGRPTFGSSAPPRSCILVGGGLSESARVSNGTGEGEGLTKGPLEPCLELRNDLRKALELLRL